jgi:hypothetical protein
MTSLRSHEGELLLDHSDSPGISDEDAVLAGLPIGAGRRRFEAPTYTCSHCQYVVILNPKRNRDRAYCRGCDHLLCDACGAERARTGVCRTFKQLIDETINAALAAPKEF